MYLGVRGNGVQLLEMVAISVQGMATLAIRGKTGADGTGV